MTWVPELTVRRGDPWAHRKGEPRPLALLWAVYLMGAALLTIFTVRSLGVPSTWQFVAACRGMIVMVALGLVVLWPTVRLSQEFPVRRWRSIGGDLLVLLLPIQAALWPMPLLTHWPASVMAGLTATVMSWALLVAALLGVAYARPDVERGDGIAGAASGLRRALCSLSCVLLVVAAPAIGVLLRAASIEAPAWLGMLSPVTSAYALTRAPAGLAPRMNEAEWFFVALPSAAAVIVVAVDAMWTRRPVGDDPPDMRSGASRVSGVGSGAGA